jgi:hypothetical protein
MIPLLLQLKLLSDVDFIMLLLLFQLVILFYIVLMLDLLVVVNVELTFAKFIVTLL